MSERIKLIRMTEKVEYLIDDLENGFTARTHEVKFDGAAFEVPMVCFAEVRDIKKISDKHTGKYGRYGVCMKLTWALEQGADRVIYAAPDREFSKRLSSVLSIIRAHHSSEEVLDTVYDLLSFVQPAKDQDDFEWRIVGKHAAFGKGEPYKPIPFRISDIENVYVSKSDEIPKVEAIIKKCADKERYSGKLPPVLLTEQLELR